MDLQRETPSIISYCNCAKNEEGYVGNVGIQQKNRMLSACIQWLADWTADLPPIVDEYDLTAWLEEEGCESLDLLLQTFRKAKTKQEAIDVLRGVLWEWFLAERQRNLDALPKAEEAVPRLLALPQTAQKSAAWYAEARDLLTGHEFAGVVYGTSTAFNAAIIKKCAPAVIVDENQGDSRTVYTSPLNPFQWGWRYEDVIRTLYEEEVADAPVCDTLGRIRHTTLPRLAASPDGLILEGPKAGRLLEIKAPISRALTGVIPQDYYCQMQLQAEVADVPAVEYVEVRFDARPLDSLLGYGELCEEERAGIRKEFLTPTVSVVSPQKPERMGMVCVVIPFADAKPDAWRYVYSPTFPLTEMGWDEMMCWKPAGNVVIAEQSVWRIADWWTTTVPRNRRWWSEVGQPAYEALWVAVDKARADGTHVLKPKCLIQDSASETSEGNEETKEAVEDCREYGCMIESD
jgi:hypothetical protein